MMTPVNLALRRRFHVGGRVEQRPGDSSTSRRYRPFNITAGHLAQNARFPPVAEMPTAQPCEWVAEKVSLAQLACSVLEAAGQGRHTLHANGTYPENGEEPGASN